MDGFARRIEGKAGGYQAGKRNSVRRTEDHRHDSDDASVIGPEMSFWKKLTPKPHKAEIKVEKTDLDSNILNLKLATHRLEERMQLMIAETRKGREHE